MQQITRNTYSETRAKSIGTHGEMHFISRGSNPCCVIGDRGILQIDTTKNPMYALNWINSVRQLTDKKFLFVVNTDHHEDHVMCNNFFDAPVISQRLVDIEVSKFADFAPQFILPFVKPKDLHSMLTHRDEAQIKEFVDYFNVIAHPPWGDGSTAGALRG